MIVVRRGICRRISRIKLMKEESLEEEDKAGMGILEGTEKIRSHLGS
jgi:hypothetical protein